MRKFTSLILLVLLLSTCLNAQVAINTDDSDPDNSAMLDVQSTEQGFLLPRLNTAQRNRIFSPATGLMVYNTDSTCLEFFNATAWFDICTGNSYTLPPLLTGSGSFAGKMCFDIAESNDDLNACGSLASRIPLRANFNQSSTYSQSYTYTPDATVSNVRFYYINTNGDVITAISGDDTGDNISTAVVATVTYNQDLSSDDPDSPGNGLAYGLTSGNPLTVDIYVVYNINAIDNGDVADDRQLNLTASVKDCDCCGLYIAPGVWKDFMCHNLGANTTLDPFTPNWDINGAYWQWGRLGPADHRQTTNTSNFAARPTDATAGGANSGLVAGWSSSYSSNTAWQDGTKTANDPCPTGYRIPTHTQWLGARENNTWTNVGASWTNSSTNYTTGKKAGASLFLPANGLRVIINGALDLRGERGYYWSSTYGSSSFAWCFSLDNSDEVFTTFGSKNFGRAVRCMAE